MNPTFQFLRHALVGATLVVSSAVAQDAVPSAKDLAAQLSGNLEDNSSSVRLKMEISKPSGGGKTVLQLQVKSRRTKSATDIVYQVLWPKERKGESFLLRKSGDRAPTGSVFTPTELAAIAEVVEERDLWVISDEAYEHLVFTGSIDGEGPLSFTSFSQWQKDRVQSCALNYTWRWTWDISACQFSRD